MNIQDALSAVVSRKDLSRLEMTDVMRDVMSGETTDTQIAGFLVALRMKGETTDEIAGAAQVMREMATPVEVSDPHLVDIVGTGGDGANLFNVSTAATFVVAAAGAKLAAVEVRLQLGEGRPALLPAGKHRQRSAVIVRAESKAPEDFVEPGLEGVTPRGNEAGVDSVVVFHQSGQLGVVVHGSHPVGDGVELGFHR